MATSKYTWIEFYQELANKLIPFKNKRSDLVNIVRKVFANTNIKLPTLDETDEDFVDIDPFTFYGLFNKGLKNETRITIAKEIASQLKVSSLVPKDFDGIPLVNNQSATFYYFIHERGANDIDNLWEIFTTALKFADNPNNVNRDAFKSIYNKAIAQRGVKWNLTMGLYWIRPNFYLNLDGRNRWYLDTKEFIDLGNVSYDKMTTALSAEEYLTLLDKIKYRIESGKTEIASLPDFSYKAWSRSEEENKKIKEAKRKDSKNPKSSNNNSSDIVAEDRHEDSKNVESPKNALPAYTKHDFLSEVYMDEENYDTLVGLLKRKKNLVLQGAPGVGKTFAAKRLAYSIMGVKDKSRVQFVQFHQNTSYEDFIMGYKPSEDGGFKLREGVFYQFCMKAKRDPENDYFFIIDEINRGNISKIFGELLMLIEADKREEESLRLSYQSKKDEEFTVPINIYIIGMMNTADRSLAVIDYALRRRFSFYTIQPAFAGKAFGEYQKGVNHEKFNNLIDVIISLNKEIAEDAALGEGFVIGHSYFCGLSSTDTDILSRLQDVVNFDIIPTIKEYWFDNEEKVKVWNEKLTQAVK